MAPKKRAEPVDIDPSSLPRVTRASTVAELKEECAARGISKGTSTLSKEGLLNKLSEGSICLCKCPEYRYVAAVRALMAEESARSTSREAALTDNDKENSELCSNKKMKSHRHDQSVAAKAQPQQQTDSKEMSLGLDAEIFDPQLRVLLQKKHKVVPATNKVRSGSGFTVQSCRGFHSEPVFDSSWSRVEDANKRAKYLFYHENMYGLPVEKMLKMLDTDRVEEGTQGPGFIQLCAFPDEFDEAWDVSVCDDRVFGNRKVAYRSHGIEPSQAPGLSIPSWLQDQTSTGDGQHGDHEDSNPLASEFASYADKYRKVTKKNKKPSGSGFTVWSSSGYPPDGFHSYEGPPEKKFDSSWASSEDANKRAKYLFYAENIWGLYPDELAEKEQVEEEAVGPKRLLKLEVHPDDNEIWTVAVVSDETFEHLKNVADNSEEEIDADGVHPHLFFAY